DDVTANIRTIRAVPLRLHAKGWPAVIEVRGEVYWPNRDFEAYNERRMKSGEEPFANPRNATAGTLKSLDSKAIADRGLSFIAHGFGMIDGASFKTSMEIFERYKQWGIPVSRDQRLITGIDNLIKFVHDWESRRHNLDFQTDGLVIKINRLDQRDILG